MNKILSKLGLLSLFAIMSINAQANVEKCGEINSSNTVIKKGYEETFKSIKKMCIDVYKDSIYFLGESDEDYWFYLSITGVEASGALNDKGQGMIVLKSIAAVHSEGYTAKVSAFIDPDAAFTQGKFIYFETVYKGYMNGEEVISIRFDQLQ